MTDKEIGDSFHKQMNEIADNLTVNQEDIMDQSSMPDFNYDLGTGNNKSNKSKQRKNNDI